MLQASCPDELVTLKVSGGYSGGVTPVPISNTVVKPSSADGTAREAVWESRTLPVFFNTLPGLTWQGVFLCAQQWA